MFSLEYIDFSTLRLFTHIEQLVELIIVLISNMKNGCLYMKGSSFCTDLPHHIMLHGCMT